MSKTSSSCFNSTPWPQASQLISCHTSPSSFRAASRACALLRGHFKSTFSCSRGLSDMRPLFQATCPGIAERGPQHWGASRTTAVMRLMRGELDLRMDTRSRPKSCPLVDMRQLWEFVSLAPWNPFAWFASTSWPPIEFSLGFSDGALLCPCDLNWWAERAATSHAAPRLLWDSLRGCSGAECSSLLRHRSQPWRRLGLDHSFALLARSR